MSENIKCELCEQLDEYQRRNPHYSQYKASEWRALAYDLEAELVELKQKMTDASEEARFHDNN